LPPPPKVMRTSYTSLLLMQLSYTCHSLHMRINQSRNKVLEIQAHKKLIYNHSLLYKLAYQEVIKMLSERISVMR